MATTKWFLRRYNRIEQMLFIERIFDIMETQDQLLDAGAMLSWQPDIQNRKHKYAFSCNVYIL